MLPVCLRSMRRIGGEAALPVASKMGGYPAPVVEGLHGGGGHAHLHLLPHQSEGDAVVMPVHRDVVVDVGPGLPPLGVLVPLGRQRLQRLTSAVCVGELFKGAFRSSARERHLQNIEKRVLPAVTLLPFDVATARVFGEIRAELEEKGRLLPDADIQIAATAVHHGLELVTGNIRHFRRIPRLEVNLTLAEARRGSR
jgi:tRNA(fMet)-specific endonuclease VapC